MSKYGAVRTEVDGIKFASKKEARRWGELKLLAKVFKIRDLRVQPEFKININNFPVCSYFGDFEYREAGSDDLIVEDVKSPATRKNPVYRLKKRLVYACHNISIREV
jgi:hypothetical protein